MPTATLPTETAVTPGPAHAPASLVQSDLRATVSRDDLAAGVALAIKATSTKSSLPILSHLLVSQDERGRVTLSGADLELWIEHTLPADPPAALNLTAPGAATLPAKSLQELLAGLPSVRIDLRAEGGGGLSHSVRLTANKSAYKLLGLAPDEFPPPPTIDKSRAVFRIAAAEMARAIRQVLYAASDDDTRPILTGVLLERRDGHVRMVATDTHRLAVRTLASTSAAGDDFAVVIPDRAWAELGRALGDDGEIVITVAESYARFSTGDPFGDLAVTTLVTRIIDGKYPDYRRILPDKPSMTLSFDRKTMLAAVRRSLIVAREGSANRLILTYESSSLAPALALSATSGSLGNAAEIVEAACGPHDASIVAAYNAKYLIDALMAIEGDAVRLDLTEPLRPALLRGDDDNYFSVLMPMQVV